MKNQQQGHGKLHRIAEYMGLVTLPVLIVIGLYLSVADLLRLHDLFFTATAIFSGLLFADFISGFVHWFCDTYGSEKTPLLGQTIADFRRHHVAPREITEHGFVYTNGDTFIFGSFLGLPLVLGCYYFDHTILAWCSAFFFTSAIFASLANSIHKWAHQYPQDNTALVRFLQKYHLVLNPAHHQVHHSRPHDRHYTITFGWLNYILDGLYFWRFLELLFRILGLKATNQQNDETGTSAMTG